MRRSSHFSLWPFSGCLLLAVLWNPTTPAARALELWTGPAVTFDNLVGSDPTLPQNQDRLTANVWLTRGATRGLYNAAIETSYSSLSPVGTEWAYGSLNDFASLNYQPWVAWCSNQPPNTVGRDAVLHLIPDDVYLSIQFTFWNMRAGGFTYTRSTPAVPEPSGSLLFALGLTALAAISHRLQPRRAVPQTELSD